MVLLFYYDTTRRSSDERCFIFERCLLVDRPKSKMLVFLNIKGRHHQNFFSINEVHQFLSQQRSSLVFRTQVALPKNE